MAQNTNTGGRDMEESLDLGPPVGDQEQSSTTIVTTQESHAITVETVHVPVSVVASPVSTREIVLTGVGLVLAIAILFAIKRKLEVSFVNQRVSPNRASLAGWFFFLGATGIFISLAFYILYPLTFVLPLFYGPVVAAILLSFLFAFIFSRN